MCSLRDPIDRSLRRFTIWLPKLFEGVPSASRPPSLISFSTSVHAKCPDVTVGSVDWRNVFTSAKTKRKTKLCALKDGCGNWACSVEKAFKKSGTLKWKKKSSDAAQNLGPQEFESAVVEVFDPCSALLQTSQQRLVAFYGSPVFYMDVIVAVLQIGAIAGATETTVKLTYRLTLPCARHLFPGKFQFGRYQLTGSSIILFCVCCFSDVVLFPPQMFSLVPYNLNSPHNSKVWILGWIYLQVEWMTFC